MALMALLENQEGASKVEAILSTSDRESPSVFMSAVNWGEVYYSTWHDQGREVADRVAGRVAGLPLIVVAADQAQARLAAELKAVYRLPYADSFAAALAIIRKSRLVTADFDFQAVARRVPILWLGRPRKRR